MPYDLNGDGKVDLKEIFQVAKAYGSCPGRPNWDPNADVDNDLKVDLKDYYTICKHYGTSYP
jgi:Ca2+-binding EF-hand superfamily protein